jgi:beta-galactosidase
MFESISNMSRMIAGGKLKIGISMFTMKNYAAVLIIFLTASYSLFAGEKRVLKSGWKFAKGDIPNAMETDFDDSQWKDISIPHDWAIDGPFDPNGDGNTAKLPWKGVGWYRSRISFPKSDEGKRVYLLFDGVMAFPEVYVNGKLAGRWDYGYNSFYLDVTKYITYGKENILAVKADTRKHDSRWYPGAGIYRKISVILADPLHIGIWGTYITTPIVKNSYAVVRIRSQVWNKSESDAHHVKLRYSIISEQNIEIADTALLIDIIPRGKNRYFEADLILSSPARWSIEHPILYKVKSVVESEGAVTDTVITHFGVRSIRFTADHGFYLNDKRVQFKGVNLHHDLGPLGTAFNRRALQRELEIMKSMGCNAVRTSHNAAAPELLDMCDKMGILVFNEIFDKYDGKADITDTTNFECFAYRNIRNFVLRDRNHPSVFIWSVGNEMADVQQNINSGFHKLHTMVNYVRKFDPTRPVTMVCDWQDEAVNRHFDYYDVHSWNYGRRYKLARQLEPNKAVIVSESASTLSTRGFYELPLPKRKTDFTKSLQVSSYDLNAPEWAEISDDDFMWQEEEDYIAGEFVWTGFDYLGEPTPYNNAWAKENGLTAKAASRSSYFGIVDLCGIPKDRYYLYKSYWKPQEVTVHILPHWNWQGREGKRVPVFVYTNGDCAELFLNGKSLGIRCKKPRSKKSVERFRLMWTDIRYQPGTLIAVAYKEGAEIGRDTVRTAGAPYRIKLTADRKKINADNEDLSYILVEAYDKEGNLCPLAENNIRFIVEGTGYIAGVGNGNPQSFTPFKADHKKLFYGKAMLIIGSTGKKGAVSVKAVSQGLAADSLKIICGE